MNKRPKTGKRILHALALLLIVCGSLLVANCPNPWIIDILQPKTITFDTDGGAPVPNAQTVFREYPIKRPVEPKKSGNVFGGWWYTEQINGEPVEFEEDFNTAHNKDLTLYAMWIPDNTTRFTVKFDADNGSGQTSQTVIKGEKANKPTDPVKEGYTFVHWFNTATDTEWDFNTAITANITLKAKWNINTYTVTFDADNGTANTTQTVDYGNRAIKPTDLAKAGWTFVHWFNIATNTEWNFNTAITAAITLKARWTTEPIFTVTFDADNGTANTTQTVIEGEKANKPTDPAKDGHTFNYWFNTATNVEWDFNAPITANITLKAKWNINKYTVSFNSNDGSAVAPITDVSHGSPIAAPTAPTRTGYTFVGWYKEAALTNQWNFATDTVTATITLYAKWNINAYTVSFNSNGGNAVAAIDNVSHGSTIAEPADPTRTGYTFDNWYSDAGLTAAYNFSTPVIESFTLYAKWNATVTFNINGGSGTVPAAQTVDAGSPITITLPNGSGFNRDGCTFGGWNTNANGNGTNYPVNFTYAVTANTTLYAKWELTAPVSGTSLADKLAWLQSNAQSGIGYTVEVDADENIGPHSLSYSGRTDITVTLIGVGANQTVVLSSNGSLFTVASGVTLVLDNNITLRGRSANNAPLVSVSAGGTLIMNAGSAITGNKAQAAGGGVQCSGTFTMSGGTISGNTAPTYGGGVFVNTNGIFTMSGGTISGNTATAHGGGVAMTSTGSGGTFTMSGGTISGNTASTNGGGVRVYIGTFTKTGGTINGYIDGDPNSNTVKDSGAIVDDMGHAVYAAANDVIKRKETAAGTGVNLSWSGTTNPPGFSGGWDY